MALLVWMPLLGNLDNQGLSNIAITNSGATSANDGKIGKCYSFNGSSNKIELANLPNPKNISVAFWMKRSSNTGTRQFMFTAWNGVTCELTTDNKVTCSVYNGAKCTSSSTVTTSSGWVHVVYTFEDSVGGKLYINGSLVASTAYSGSIAWSTTTGNIGYYSTYYNGKLNDFRIYDNVLSLAEIKELSKGLVAHYTLDDRMHSANMIVNGFGELGTENLENSNVSTTEIPSGHSEIKASMYNGNSTVEYIPINPNHRYTLSCYIKSSGATTGTTYPSVFPYDIDKKFIRNQNSRVGFNTATATTLSQELKKGDTVIHATDLSQWTTANDYYYRVAIFGYHDSTGYVYPDLTYTQDTPQFGTRTDKSHIDKTNNTITLNSAYTGEGRPAGTTICQATNGSTNWYPYGGIALSSLSDWVFKTTNFIAKNDNRLLACKYIRWSSYGNTYMAGSLLVDNDDKYSTLIDCSGNQYNGTISSGATVSTNTPRYSLSTNFYNNSYAQITGLTCDGYTNSFTIAFWAVYPDASSKMAFGYSNGNKLNLYFTSSIICLNTGDGTNNPFKNNGTNVSATPYLNSWHHYAITGNGTTNILYIDGVEVGRSTTYKGITGTTLTLNGWDTGSNYKINNRISDFRIYATPLSAEDIKRLYDTPACVSNNGTMLTYGEYIEG